MIRKTFVSSILFLFIALPAFAQVTIDYEVPAEMPFTVAWEPSTEGETPDLYELERSLNGQAFQSMVITQDRAFTDTLHRSETAKYRVRGILDITYQVCNEYPCAPEEILTFHRRDPGPWSDMSGLVVSKTEPPGKPTITITITVSVQ